MLQRIRDKSSGPLAYAIVGLIALVFSVWGLGSYFTESANPAVAEVGGTKITKYELQRAYDQRYARLQELMGDDFDHDSVDPQQFRRSVLEGLIQRELLSQYAKETGYRITDGALIAKLRSDSRFQVDGSFSAERYRALLSQAGISASAFESGMRGDMQIQQIRSGVLDTAFVSDREIARANALRNQRRQAAYLAFRPDAFADEVEIEDAEIESYYRDNPNAFMREQRVKLKYVVLDRSKLDIAQEPDEKYLKTLYDQEKQARFKTPERRMARHILVRIDDDTDASAARTRIQELASKLDSSDKSFAELARANSDDASTADKGGKLDWVSRGTMVAPFEEALFKLEPGEVSAPVKTEFGWHLIKLEEVDPAEIKPLDDPDVRAELIELYRSRERDERYKQMAERLDALSFEAPESLDAITDELELEVRSSGWVTRSGGEGVAGNEAVIKAAFSDSVLKDGLNSTPIQLSGDRQVVVRVAEQQDAQRRPLDAVRDQIRQTLTEQAASKLARKQAEAALEAARGGDDLRTLAGDGPGEFRDVGWVNRNGDRMSGALRDKLYTLPRPGGDAPSYGMATSDDGLVAVLRLTDVESPDLKKDAGQQLRRSVRGRIAGLEFSALRQSIRDDFDVVIHDERLQ